MANDLQTTRQSQLTQCLKLSVSAELAALIDRPVRGVMARLITPAERAELADKIIAFEDQLCPTRPSEIEECVGMLTLAYPAMKVSVEVASARLQLYVEALSDIPAAFLRVACMKALQELKFFPSVAEIRERCEGLALMQYRLMRMKHLVSTYDRDSREPETLTPMSDAERTEMERVLGGMGAR